MTRSRPRSSILRELVVVILILGCVGGTFALVLNAHRKARSARINAPPGITVATLPAAPPESKPTPRPPKAPPATRLVPPPPEDPTPRIVAGLAADADRERQAAREADRKANALGAARRLAESEIQRHRRREALVRAQLATLDDQARNAEAAADDLAHERDVLARERDAARAALEKANARGGGYAVLPHKGPSGTWQRPVVIECRDGVAILQPRGLSFTMLDMSPLLGTRSNPMVGAVARELMRIEDLGSPDGEPITPYIYFIVRPNGVRPFYEARGRLEPLGIAFGYELVDQDWEIEFPDLDTWELGGASRPIADGRSFRWPSERPGGESGNSSNPFLWPRTPPGGTAAGDPGISHGAGSGRSRVAGDDGEPRPGGINRRRLPEGIEGLLGQLGEGGLPPEGMDVTPLLDAFERVGPDGLQRLLEARRGSSPGRGGTGTGTGLAGVPTHRLPELEGAEDSVGPSAVASRSEVGGESSPKGSDSFDRIPIVPEMLGDRFEDRPPARPRNEPPGSPLDGAGRPGGLGASAGTTGPPSASGSGSSSSESGGGTIGSSRSNAVVVPLDLIVACGPSGVTIHPGGYRITKATLAGGGRLVRDLETIVQNYRVIDPNIIPRPRLEFLIEVGGHETFAEARRQTVLLGRDWPVSIRVAESSAPNLFRKERF